MPGFILQARIAFVLSYAADFIEFSHWFLKFEEHLVTFLFLHRCICLNLKAKKILHWASVISNAFCNDQYLNVN